MKESVISWVRMQICSSVRFARSGGRSVLGACWDVDKGGRDGEREDEDSGCFIKSCELTT